MYCTLNCCQLCFILVVPIQTHKYMNLTNIQNQFNDHAEKYMRSPFFSTGESLDKMIELLQKPKINRALDVATGAGHTAMRLCSISDYVVAGDVTVPMLKAARELMVENKANNVSCCQHDAHMLPFPKQTFDFTYTIQPAISSVFRTLPYYACIKNSYVSFRNVFCLRSTKFFQSGSQS